MKRLLITGIFVLFVGLFSISAAYGLFLAPSIGRAALPLEPEFDERLGGLLTDAAGNPLANISFHVTSGSRAAPGSPLLFEVKITRLASERVPMLLAYEFVHANTNQSFFKKNERVTGNASFFQNEMRLPDVIPEGNYFFLLNVSTRTNSLVMAYPISVERTISNPWLEEHLSFFLSIVIVVSVIGAGLYYVFWLRRDLKRKERDERQRNSPYPFPDFASLPQSKYAYIGKLADADEKAYLDHTQLNKHTLIAGGTGSGKTVAGMVIAEELFKQGMPVIVFDPVGQWSGFAKPNRDERMRALYQKFEMGVPKAFSPRVLEVTDATMGIDITHYLFMRGITVFRLDKLTPRKVDEFIEQALLQIYQARLPEAGMLKSLVILDEVHRLLPKYGGKKAYLKLEQAVREFRKWGVGLIMISQVLTDFKGAIRGNIGTEIQVHTRYEGDIQRVRERHGVVVSNLIAKLPTGVAMVENADYNKGNPYFIEFRPLLHSQYKLTETEAKALLRKETPMLKMNNNATSSSAGTRTQ
jgi:hypothetical protein